MVLSVRHTLVSSEKGFMEIYTALILDLMMNSAPSSLYMSQQLS